jgi:hypothetical protein
MLDNNSPPFPDIGEGAAAPNDGGDGSDTGNRQDGGSDARNRQDCWDVPASGSVIKEGHDHCEMDSKKAYGVNLKAAFARVAEETKDMDKEALEARFPWMSECLGIDTLS